MHHGAAVHEVRRDWCALDMAAGARARRVSCPARISQL